METLLDTTQLAELISDLIKHRGIISFRDYMEMALYQAELGYYTSPKVKIGPGGDYYTSAVLTPVFAALIAKQLEEMWRCMGKQAFTIVEYGAGTGALCRGILSELHERFPEFYQHLRYIIIERSPAMRELELDCNTDKVSWHDNLHTVGRFSGCILSNEVLDNFSVHRVAMQDQLMEVFVGHDGNFKEVLRPAGDDLNSYFRELGVTLPFGFCSEINLQAISWLEEIALFLDSGFVLTIDYGYASAELYHNRRRHGTLLCYHQHQINDDPYRLIGEQDITAHVNFSALAHWGLKSGLDCCGFLTQGNFLRSLGLMNVLRTLENAAVVDPLHMMQLQNLLLDLGSRLKVLVQSKNLIRPRLSGLTLAEKLLYG